MNFSNICKFFCLFFQKKCIFRFFLPKNIIFFRFYLHMSWKSSTFAPAFCEDS